MEKKKLNIHSENILPIIKQWLYSDRDIFARELVSNACDALHKTKILRDQGEIEVADEEFRVEVKVDKEARTLKFIDTGIGMDADEVQKYIAQIAFSSAEDFLEKYKSKKEEDQIIGHFGLGFYSAFMVAKKVEIQTLSYKKDAQPVFWSCDGSIEYELGKGNRTSRGTEITLYVNEENDEFLEEGRIKEVLAHYCSFLPHPIYLGDTRLNSKEPLWIRPPSECEEKDYLEFYRHLYPMQEDPLFWVHLNVDYPFHLKGILYFPKLRRDMDYNRSTIQLFCNRVFVSDNCKDIIPEYLMMLQGVIDSPDIPLNVSRSSLQMDRTVRQLSQHISKKVSDSISSIYRGDREKFLKFWEDVSLVVKMGVLEDPKFYERAKEFLVWKTVDGDWMTAEEYLEKNREKTDSKIFYTKAEKNLHPMTAAYRDKGIDVVCTELSIDPYLFQFLEGKLAPAQFQRVDGAVDKNLLDPSREKSVLDADGKTEAGKLADFVRSHLNDENLEVEAKSLAADSLPGFIVMDENQRRMRDYMMAMNPQDPMISQMQKRTFVVNTNNPLVSAVQKLNAKQPEMAADLVKQMYELALLSQREMHPELLNEFITHNVQVLEKLAKIAAES